MKQNNFRGTVRPKGVTVGLTVRLSLALVALAGSVTLAWTLVNAHGTHAAGQPTLMNTCTATGIFNPTFLQLDNAGHVWFTDPTNNAIGELAISSNTWQEFTAGITAHGQPSGLVRDTTGNLWFTEQGAPLGRIPATETGNLGKIGFFNTTTHAVVETPVPNTLSQPDGMTYDAVHNVVWFAEDKAPKIGSFAATADGAISIEEYTSNSNANPPDPHLITLDRSGNVWYSEQGSDLIGQYDPTLGFTRQYSAAGNLCPTAGVTPTPCTNTSIDGIAVDSTGIVWFDETQTAQLGSLNQTTATVGNGSPGPIRIGPVNKTWYFADGRVGEGFTEYLSLDNPTANAAPSLSRISISTRQKAAAH